MERAEDIVGKMENADYQQTSIQLFINPFPNDKFWTLPN